ncbi:MAG: CHAP domain-containing protein [Azoarcus sp.]|jgi:surface antigen|nr:CHAP domain-containing protein [Azoarcus sp.]
MKKKFLISPVFLALTVVTFIAVAAPQIPGQPAIGDPVDSFNGVIVYYNGPVSNVSGRNLASDNYNIGLKFQCVEFVKRYYYEFYRHKMPDSYGHAKDFFDLALKDGEMNERRALIQYRNPSQSKPKVGDLVVFDGHIMNSYGHVAIISDVKENEIEIIQQNPGMYEKSRVNIRVRFQEGMWRIDHEGILGWLRKESA